MKKSRVIYYIYLILAVAIITVLSIISRKSVAFSEWYATHIYFFLQSIISRITGIFPFSLYELLIIGGIFLLLFILYRTVYLCIRRSWKKLRSMYARVLALVLTLFLIFVTNCGVNYHRRPFSYYSGLTIEKRSTDELIRLCEYMIAQANALVPYIDTRKDETYGAVFSLDNTDERKEAVLAMENLAAVYPVLDRYYPKPKPVLFSKVMSYEFITGVYSALTIEANYNNDVPDYIKAYTMCHELSHLTGFMREDEAGFIAYLACIYSDNANFRYSGLVNALSYVLSSVYSNCGAEIYTGLYRTMDAQIIRDYVYDHYYWKKYETPVAEVADAVNNAYLQANAQADGVKSYGRMVDLLLAYYSSQNN